VTLDDDTARELSRAAKQVQSFTERRNALIHEAVAAGHGIREVARATGLSPATIHNMIKPRKRGAT
jgi:DNA-binding NarL/FixJ family response regulator